MIIYKTGITALIDEATGFEKKRPQNALQEILDMYIGRELARWVKRFPDEFYEQIFRLKGWSYDRSSSKRPMMMAKLTLDLVYDRIGPGLTEELRNWQSEIKETTGKKGKLHQLLTENVGHPALQNHLAGITFTAKTCADGEWDKFYKMMDKAAPRYYRTPLLPFGEEHG